MTACATLQIDSCPIEGFDTDKYNTILNLKERHMNTAVIAAVGYRSNEDLTQNQKKVRKASNVLLKPFDLMFDLSKKINQLFVLVFSP